MNCTSDVVGKFVKRGEEAEKLREAWGDSNGEYGVPDKKSNNGMLSDFALFPCDFGMRKVSNDSSDSGSNKIGKPEKVVI